MTKFYAVLSVFLAILTQACGKKGTDAPGISAITVQSQIADAGLAKNWLREDKARLFISSAGSFSLIANTCGIIGSVEKVTPLSDCLSWVTKCGTTHIRLSDGSNCPGYTSGSEVICTYQRLDNTSSSALGYDLMLSCNGPMTDAQRFVGQ